VVTVSPLQLVDEQTDAPKRRSCAFLKWIISRRRWVILIVRRIEEGTTRQP
jgi:hypothetical protein